MDAAEIERDLDELESKIEELRARYEQYFVGLERLEPLTLRKDVERRARALRREQLRNTAQRFKLTMLLQRMNTMQQHWSRVVREIENGTYRRDVVRAAARFGESALAALGSKKAKELAATVAKRATIAEARDIEAPAPPRAVAPAEAPPHADPIDALPEPVVELSARGLAQGDLPVIASESAPPLRVPAPPRAGGLRWGSAPADPSTAPRPSAADVQRRVAELAAEMRGARKPEPAARPADPAAGAADAGFGDLDLEFDDSLVSSRPPPVLAPTKPLAPPANKVARPVPPPTPTQRAHAETSPRVPNPAPPAPPPPTRDAPPVPTAAGSSSSAAARPPPLPPRPVRPAIPTSVPAVPVTSSSSEGDIPDQRLRQIYAKYVASRRVTQEPTAGVTFEKLAASLRAEATKLKSSHPTKSVDYEVVIKDGKTHLKPILR